MPGGSNSQPSASAPPVTDEQATTQPRIRAQSRAALDLIGWGQTLAVALVATIISSAALLIEFASKRNAIATNRSPGFGMARYDAGWPLIYAHVDLIHLSSRTYNAVIAWPPRLRIIAWGALALDTAIVALLFTVGFALIAGLFLLAWRARPHNAEKKPSLRRFTSLTFIGLLAAGAWEVISWWEVSSVSASMPTDAATLQAILQFPGDVLLAPGVLQYLTQLWFESDHFLAISLTGGTATQIEGVAIVLVSWLFPAALCAFVFNGSVRLTQWWQKQ